ncbi:hypothetical protein C5167_032581, partial [Papaver somniferum]
NFQRPGKERLLTTFFWTGRSLGISVRPRLVDLELYLPDYLLHFEVDSIKELEITMISRLGLPPGEIRRTLQRQKGGCPPA